MKLRINSVAHHWISYALNIQFIWSCKMHWYCNGSHVHAEQKRPSRHQWGTVLRLIRSLPGMCLACSLRHGVWTCNTVLPGNLSGSPSRIQRRLEPPKGSQSQPSLQDSIRRAKIWDRSGQLYPQAFFHLPLHPAGLLFLSCCIAHTSRKCKRRKLFKLE